MERPLFSARNLAILSSVILFSGTFALAQQLTGAARTAGSNGYQHGVYLVFPFENAGASPRFEWLGEGLEELTIQRLSAAGEQVYSHAGRQAELERYGLPHNSKLSRATMLHIAEDLDADFVVLGRFKADGTSLTVESRMLRVNPAAMQQPLEEKGALDSLMDLQTRLVWRMLSASAHNYPLTLAEFTKRQRALRLDSFEHYIRGLLAADDDAKLRELHEAARLEPDWPDPGFALGEVYYARRDFSSALAWYFKVPKSHDRYVEAAFASAVCRLFLNQPDHAEETLTALQGDLRSNLVAGADLPELLNDLAIALARQGKLAAAQNALRRAAELDPDEDDYPFNLGLLLLQTGDPGAAAGYFREAAQREPDNAEDRALLIYSLEKADRKPEADQERGAADEAFGPNALPVIHVDSTNEYVARLSRITMELDVTAVRAEIEMPEAPADANSASGSDTDTPVAHVRRGRQEFSAGHTEAAEKEYRAALMEDPGNAAAHRGLAEIERREGKLEDAVKELHASLEARDSAVVRTMLAKIYLEQKKPELAREQVERALRLAPNYAEAKQLLEHLQSAKPSEKRPGGGS
jgi:tetratricopeptide (TPR) repeat protein/TolB-like protein